MAKKPRIPKTIKKTLSQIFTKPATTKYPFEKTKVADTFRGEPIFNTENCIGCSLCSKNCPAKAIEMVEVNGKKLPQCRLDKCIYCNQCIDVCPKKAIQCSGVFELATTDKSELIKKPQ
jgi:formate hydrogenlyase subunit 6/NADH:ubiquinone oxidoreductase subunit I